MVVMKRKGNFDHNLRHNLLISPNGLERQHGKRLLLCLGYYKAHDDATNQARNPDNNADRHRGNKENSRDSHHRSHQ